MNPNAEEAEGDRCYRNVAAIPGGVDAAVVVTRPEVSASVVDDCAASAVRWIWLHRSFGKGSVSDEAIERCRIHGISVIPGGCPMMHCAPVDRGHACMRVMLSCSAGCRWLRKCPSRRPALGASGELAKLLLLHEVMHQPDAEQALRRAAERSHPHRQA